MLLIKAPAGNAAPDLGEERLVIEPLAAQQLYLEPGGVPPGQLAVQAPEVAFMTVFFVLYQQRSYLPAHVIKDLLVQLGLGSAVLMIHEQVRKIIALISFGQGAVPVFRIAAAACG